MRSKLPLIILSVLLLYFLGHALFGRNQTTSLVSLTQEVNDLKRELETLSTQRRTLEAKIYALRPETLDLDYVEELARQRLYMMYPDELMIVFEPEQSDISQQ